MHDHVVESRERLNFIWLELTARCNLECVHCYADSSPERPLSAGMERKDWEGALDAALALGCKQVQFIGGEPTIHPDLSHLIEHARRIGYEQICVYTNGTHFTEALKTIFVEQRVGLAFSVYGSSGEVHDKITQRAGSFAKTRNALRWAIAAGLPVRVGVIEMAVNQHDISETKRMLSEMGVNSLHVDRLRGLGRGTRERPSQPRVQELCGRCGDGKVCVSSSGEIYPCVFARFAAVGHIREGGLAAAFDSPQLYEFRKTLISAHIARQIEPRDSEYHGSVCSPEEPAPSCGPERPAPPCSPEIPPPPCNPEIVPPDCAPEKPQPPCSPEVSSFNPQPSRAALH